MIDLTKEIYAKDVTAHDKILRLYGKDVSNDLAGRYVSGIKLHLKTVNNLDNNFKSFESSQEVSFNKDKTQTIKQDIYLSEDEAASPTKIMQKMKFSKNRFAPKFWSFNLHKTFYALSFFFSMRISNKVLTK